MSHLVACKCVLRDDPELLERTCQTLGWEFHYGGRVRYYMGNGQECHYTIEFSDPRLSKTYNIGLTREGEGLRLHIDNSIHGPVLYDGSLGGRTPELIHMFSQEYAVQNLKRTAYRQGMVITRECTDTAGNRWLEVAEAR